MKNKRFRRTKEELKSEIENIVGKKNYDDYKKFAFKKSMLEVAVAFVLGISFQKVISSLSQNIIMPTMNHLASVVSGDKTNWRDRVFSPIEGLELEVGKVAGTFVDFMLISLILFIIYKKLIQPIIKENNVPKSNTNKCSHCLEVINKDCKRCPCCTSWLKEVNPNES